MKKSTEEKNKKSPGNTIEAPKNYKDPTGKNTEISHPESSGYEEKQPSVTPKPK